MLDLFSPLSMAELHLKNRVVMPPMANNMADDRGEPTRVLTDHYLARGRDGVALLMVEHSYVSPRGKASLRQTGMHADALVGPWASFVKEVKATGAAVGIQLNHAGSRASKDVTGELPLGPSPLVHPRGGDTPRGMSLGEIEKTVDDFYQAARRAKEAGFDVVEIHGAHGFLLNQFFSPLTNRREDEYGGSRENRFRLFLEVIAATRNALGKGTALFFRLGADDRMDGGLTLEDGCWAARELERAGVDVVDLSGGHCGYLQNGGPGFFLYMSEAVKPLVQIPVMLAGGLGDPVLADLVVRQGKADLVGVGRALLKDAGWVTGARELLKGRH